MTSSHTIKGTRRYRYYVCRRAQKHGWQSCPAPSLPAGPIEELVVRQIQALAPAVAPEAFVAVWQALPLAEQARVLQRLVERVDYHAAQQTVSITFRADASTALAEEWARSTQETNPCASQRETRICPFQPCRQRLDDKTLTTTLAKGCKI